MTEAPREPRGDGKADARRAAAHERHFSAKLEIHALGLIPEPPPDIPLPADVEPAFELLPRKRLDDDCGAKLA
jgi:hypothetical protein